jgi:hypothetical protein
MQKKGDLALSGIPSIKKKALEKIVIFLLFLSASFSITYWAIAKYDVYSDYHACGDTHHYIKMSLNDFSGVEQRYRNRPLMPFLVSLLNKHLNISHFLSRYYEDVDKKIIQLNFGIVNILCLTFTSFLFFYYCLRLGFSKQEGLIGGFLYLTSFFVVNYYTVPMADSLSVFFILAGFYAILQNSLVGLFLSFSLGVFTKETTFLLLLLIFLEERRFFSKKLLVCLPGIVAYAIFVIYLQESTNNTAGLFIFRDFFNIIQGRFLLDGFSFFSLYTLIENIQIFLFLWVLFAYALFKCKKPEFLKRAIWLMILPVITPFLGAGAVGRVVFYFFPIVIPLSLLALREILSLTARDSLIL